MINKNLRHKRTQSTDERDHEVAAEFTPFLPQGHALLKHSKRKVSHVGKSQFRYLTTEENEQSPSILLKETPLLVGKVSLLWESEIVSTRCQLLVNLLRFEGREVLLSDMTLQRKELVRHNQKCYIILLGEDLIMFFYNIERLKQWYSYLKQFCLRTNLLLKFRMQEQLFQDYFTVVKKKNRQLYSAIVLPKEQPHLRQTIAQLYQLKHSMVQPIRALFDDSNSFVIITDFFDAEPLFNYLVQGVRLNEVQLATLSYQILMLIKYLSENNAYHGNITPMNILINRESANLEMAAIGFCSYRFKKNESTRDYREWVRAPFLAPMLQEGPPGVLSDLYQLGVLIYMVTFFRGVDKKADPIEVYERVLKNLKLDQDLLEQTKKELNSMLQSYNSSHSHPIFIHVFASSQIDLIQKLLKGCRLQEAINHPWFINAKQKAKGAKKQNKIGLPSLQTIVEIKEHMSEQDVLVRQSKHKLRHQLSILRPSIELEENQNDPELDEESDLLEMMNSIEFFSMCPSKSHHEMTIENELDVL